MKTFICILFLLIPFSADAGECKTSGKAILWADDACLGEHETDDSIHPGVIECVSKGKKLTKTVDACETKRVFKSRIIATSHYRQTLLVSGPGAGPLNFKLLRGNKVYIPARAVYT